MGSSLYLWSRCDVDFSSPRRRNKKREGLGSPENGGKIKCQPYDPEKTDFVQAQHTLQKYTFRVRHFTESFFLTQIFNKNLERSVADLSSAPTGLAMVYYGGIEALAREFGPESDKEMILFLKKIHTGKKRSISLI